MKSTRVAVRVTKDALRHVRAGHPWVFDRSIVSLGAVAAPGDLGVIFDDKRQFVGIGLLDPSSPLRLRVLHHGDPIPIDAAWFRSRIQQAVDLREPLRRSRKTNAYRLVHGENDGLPGVVVDFYDRVAVVKLYTAAWTPWLDVILDALTAVVSPSAIVVRSGRVLGDESFVARGELAESVVSFKENGLTFEADVLRGQKTGHFLDQRENRFRVRGLAKGIEVLDVFCSTGGFGLNGASGGASAVHFVDQSTFATDAAKRHMAINGLDERTTTRATVGDGFDVLKKFAAKGRRFGMVVIDPPSFARRQTDVDVAIGAYRRLTQLALDVLEDDGVLVQASCSSHVPAEEFCRGVFDVAAQRRQPLREIVRTAHGLDHPISFSEGAYLKAVFARRAG